MNTRTNVTPHEAVTFRQLCLAEGWEVIEKPDASPIVIANDKEHGLVHPYQIHLKLYREARDPDERFNSMRRIHDMLWPHHIQTWNYWTERRFRAHCEGWRIISLASGAGTGKAQPLSAKIKTPSGWVTMADIKVGDIICNPKGGVQTVTAIHPQGIKPCYEVKFSDDSVTRCCEDHLWEVQSKKQRDHNQGKSQIISTEQLKKTITRNYCIPAYPACVGISLPDLPDPYVIGYAFGNAHFTIYKGCVVSCPDLDVVEHISALWPVGKVTFTREKNCYVFSLLQGTGYFRQFSHKLSHQKKLPAELLFLDPANRLKLLQGLLDSDGSPMLSKKSKHATGAEFSSTSKVLANQVLELARSLGYVSTISKPRITKFNDSSGNKKDGKKSWRVSIVVNPGQPIPFLSDRKSSQFPGTRTIIYRRRILSVKAIQPEICKCITVSDPAGLYFTDDHIVTHNSLDCAKIGIVFWASDPLHNAVVVASTTLESVENRIWGYVVDLFETAALRIPAKILSTAPPKILLPGKASKIHGMFAIAMTQGDDDKVISKLIGRHPKKGLMVFLDESTDMNAAITKAIPNLEEGVEFFQLYAIGNSKSWHDLHGALSTPKTGVGTVDPTKEFQWLTTQEKGICLYFNPYDSPAIHEKDPLKRILLSKFLITSEKIKAKQAEYGTDSDAYYRFTLGFWKTSAIDQTIISLKFVTEQEITRSAEWSGYYKLDMVAGLDPAFQAGGLGCKLRLGILGQQTDGSIVLDCRYEEYMFTINVKISNKLSGERQIAEQVWEILKKYRIPLGNLALDATGVGRSLGELISVISGSGQQPFRIVSTRVGEKKGETDPFICVSSPSELWFQAKQFIQHKQIKGIDLVTVEQMTNRLMFTDEKNNKTTLETKDQFKTRMNAVRPNLARSPDEADALMLLIQAAVLRYGFSPGQTRALPAPTQRPMWLQKAIVYGLEQHELEMAQSKAKRPALIANFSAPIESLVKQRSGRG